MPCPPSPCRIHPNPSPTHLPVPLEGAELADVHAARPALLGGGAAAHLARHHQLLCGRGLGGSTEKGDDPGGTKLRGKQAVPVNAGRFWWHSAGCMLQPSQTQRAGKHASAHLLAAECCMQHSTAQHSTAQHSTAQRTCVAGSQCRPRLSNSSSKMSSNPCPAPPLAAVERTYLRQVGGQQSAGLSSRAGVCGKGESPCLQVGRWTTGGRWHAVLSSKARACEKGGL